MQVTIYNKSNAPIVIDWDGFSYVDQDKFAHRLIHAVVAQEVGKLAGRSQTAAGEITELSIKTVELAEKAGTMLSSLVPDIQKTAGLVQEISAASNEQNSGADQINTAIVQLDNVVQQNASASEQLAGTSKELSSQAGTLQQAVSFFKIDANGGAEEIKMLPAQTVGISEYLSPVESTIEGGNGNGNGHGQERELIGVAAPGNGQDDPDQGFEDF